MPRSSYSWRGCLTTSLTRWLLLCILLTFGLQSGIAAEEEQGVIEEVIVFAQKRAEGSQDVPVALTALSGQALREAGALTIEELTDLNPSLSFDTAQSWQNNSLKIRGIGTVGNTRSFEGAVGVFIDEVYRPRSGMALADLFDISTVEVLRGPQTTLFGKNTVAGAVSVRSNRPDPEATAGYVDVRAANYDGLYANAAFNAPLNEALTLRVAGTRNQRDGFFESPDTGAQYDEIDRHAVKAQLLIKPQDDWEFLLMADAARSDAACCWGSAQVVNGPVTPLVQTYSALNGLTFVSAPQSEEQRSHTLNLVPRELVLDSGILAKTTWDIDDQWSLRSITAFRDWEHSQLDADPDFVPADLFRLSEPANIETFSQELNVSYTGERTDFLLGLYYFREDYFSERSAAGGSDADNYLNALISANLGAVACLPPVVAADCAFPVGINALLPDGEFTREAYRQDSTGYAVFAHGSTLLSERLRLIAGLRHDVIEKEGGVDNLFWYDSLVARLALAAAGVPDDGTARNGLDLIGTFNSPSFTDATRDSELTGSLQLQYDFGDSGMAYAGYHRGFKSGGVNLFREGAITNTRYAPELADSIEAGIKLDYRDGTARTNIAAFYTRFTDLQINFFTGLEFRTENTGEASTRGVEIENVWQFSNQLRLDFSVTYLDSRFDEIANPLLAYLAGRDTPRAPRWAGVAGLRYEWPLAGDRRLFARGVASYSGSHYVGADVAVEPKADAYLVADASFGLSGPNDDWEAALWCKNCFDESYRTIYFNSTFQPGSFSAYLNDPRQYGVSLRWRF